MSLKIINSFQVLSDLESKRLAHSVNQNVNELDKSIDGAEFEIIFGTIKNNNRLKLAISSLEFLRIICSDRKDSFQDFSDWSTEKTERKLCAIIPLKLPIEDVTIEVSLASTTETVNLEIGKCYIWPSFATMSSMANLDGFVYLYSQVVGKKLT